MKSGRGGRREGAGRKSGWKDPKTETTTIRVPVELVDQLMAIAKKLDSGEVLDYETKSSSQDNALESVAEITKEWRSKSHPTSTRWEKANLLLKELEQVLQIPSDAPSRESIGRTVLLGQPTYTPLKGAELAYRLGVADSTLDNRRNSQPGSILEWTKSKDPESIAWEYRNDTKKYHPVPPIDFETKSEV